MSIDMPVRTKTVGQMTREARPHVFAVERLLIVQALCRTIGPMNRRRLVIGMNDPGTACSVVQIRLCFRVDPLNHGSLLPVLP